MKTCRIRNNHARREENLVVERIKARFLEKWREKCERSSPSLRIKLRGPEEELNIWEFLLVSLCFASPAI